MATTASLACDEARLKAGMKARRKARWKRQRKRFEAGLATLTASDSATIASLTELAKGLEEVARGTSEVVKEEGEGVEVTMEVPLKEGELAQIAVAAVERRLGQVNWSSTLVANRI